MQPVRTRIGLLNEALGGGLDAGDMLVLVDNDRSTMGWSWWAKTVLDDVSQVRALTFCRPEDRGVEPLPPQRTSAAHLLSVLREARATGTFDVLIVDTLGELLGAEADNARELHRGTTDLKMALILVVSPGEYRPTDDATAIVLVETSERGKVLKSACGRAGAELLLGFPWAKPVRGAAMVSFGFDKLFAHDVLPCPALPNPLQEGNKIMTNINPHETRADHTGVAPLTVPAEKLHVFSNECDWVVAASLDDAWAAWSEHTGEKREHHEADDPLELLPDERLVKLWEGKDGKVCEVGDLDGAAVFRPAGEWARRMGRGFLASENF